MSLSEKLVIPAAGVILFFLMSTGVMLGTGGGTNRMKIVLCCATTFAAGMVYSMFWHDELAWIFGFEDAWIVVTVASGIGSVLLGRWWFAKRSNSSDSNG
jgi:hypothetical protein